MNIFILQTAHLETCIFKYKLFRFIRKIINPNSKFLFVCIFNYYYSRKEIEMNINVSDLTTVENIIKSTKQNINQSDSVKALDKNLAPYKSILSIKAKSLLKELETVLDKNFEKIKKGKDAPVYNMKLYKYHKKNKAEVSFVHLYRSYEPELLMEVKRPEFSELVYINRRNPEKFKYEKRVVTKSGHATTKTYDNRIEKDETLNEKINAMIEEYTPLFLK